MNITTSLTTAVVAIGMVLTNPSQEAYTSWASRQLTANIQQSLCHQTKLLQASSNLGIYALCTSSISLLHQSGVAKSAINVVTEQENFYLFSIYTTKTPITTYKTIGAFGKFLLFSAD
jgi:uncharacterized protein YigE (DUF2233 family)